MSPNWRLRITVSKAARLLQLNFRFRSELNDVQITKEWFYRLKVGLLYFIGLYVKTGKRGYCKNDPNLLRLKSLAIMSHEMLHPIAGFSDHISGFKRLLSVVNRLYCLQKTLGYHIYFKCDFLLKDNLKTTTLKQGTQFGLLWFRHLCGDHQHWGSHSYKCRLNRNNTWLVHGLYPKYGCEIRPMWTHRASPEQSWMCSDPSQVMYARTQAWRRFPRQSLSKNPLFLNMGIYDLLSPSEDSFAGFVSDFGRQWNIITQSALNAKLFHVLLHLPPCGTSLFGSLVKGVLDCNSSPIVQSEGNSPNNSTGGTKHSGHKVWFIA